MPKKRSDDPSFQTKMMVDAATGIKPPAYVRIESEAMPFWNVIIAARAEWTDVDLIHAANLARTMYQIEKNTLMLEAEGEVLMNMKGTKVANPRFSILETLSRRSVAISAKIQVHAAATIGEVENTRTKNKAKQKAVKSLKNLDEDDLIARPVH